MATFERDGAVLHYSEHGSGFPVLAPAPGGMRSAAAFWERAPWNPVAELAAEIAAEHPEAGPAEWAGMYDHPRSASRLIAESVPGATFVERWKDDPSLPAAIAEFLG